MIAAARTDAESERGQSAERARARRPPSSAPTPRPAIARDRAAMETDLIDDARDLSIEVAERLLRRVSPDAGLDRLS